MLASAVGSLGCLGLFIVAESPLLTLVALFLLGALAAPHYPLLKAAAYELAPRRAGAVNALTQAFVGIEILAPLALGALAQSHGLAAALAALALQPLAVLLAALAYQRAR